MIYFCYTSKGKHLYYDVLTSLKYLWRPIMGDGKKLKEYIEKKGTNVRKLAKATFISPHTLYSIINRDSNIRYDFALLLAKELDIEPEEICSTSAFSGKLTEDDMYFGWDDPNGLWKDSRVKMYVKGSLMPLLREFGPTEIQDVHKLLGNFYRLDNEARAEIVDSIDVKLKYHKDPDREDKYKKIKYL